MVNGQEIDVSGMGRGNDGTPVGTGNDESMEEDSHRTFHEGTDDDDDNGNCPSPSAPIKVWNLTCDQFLDRLVENFHYNGQEAK
mmetsp:Transcript_15433/g.31192  ORF Transcript_15433/g.31192 Transcript_15433/m.31192 type:complete len:84 (+) Transcript_15433:151-402(+)